MGEYFVYFMHDVYVIPSDGSSMTRMWALSVHTSCLTSPPPLACPMGCYDMYVYHECTVYIGVVKFAYFSHQLKLERTCLTGI